MPFAHCPQEVPLKRSDLPANLSTQFEKELREEVARARSGEFRRPNWPLIVKMLISSDALLIGSAVTGAVMGEPVRNFLFIASIFPGLMVVGLLYCNTLKLRL